MSTQKDDLGFFTGSLVALSISAAMMFGFYQWAYSRGQDSERCTRRHSYHYDKATPAFANTRIKK